MGGGREDEDDRIHRMAMEDPVAWYKKPNLRRMYLLLFPCVIGIEMTSGFDSQIINSAQLLPAWKDCELTPFYTAPLLFFCVFRYLVSFLTLISFSLLF